MSQDSRIEWTQTTGNPVTGCTKISLGCRHCYAERMARRLQAMGQPRYADGFSVSLHEDLVSAPNAWGRPRLVFVNSMSDLFHEAVPTAFIERVFQTMGECPQHVFQILTKRSARLRELAPRLHWSRNIWIGVTVEDRQAERRVDDLVEVPASTRSLSGEPLLESLGQLPLDGIDWVIVGGESGPGARPMRQEWVEEVLAQCRQSTCRSSSSSGAARGRNAPGGRSTAAHTTSTLGPA
jgi:protein gp37